MVVGWFQKRGCGALAPRTDEPDAIPFVQSVGSNLGSSVSVPQLAPRRDTTAAGSWPGGYGMTHLGGTPWNVRHTPFETALWASSGRTVWVFRDVPRPFVLRLRPRSGRQRRSRLEGWTALPRSRKRPPFKPNFLQIRCVNPVAPQWGVRGASPPSYWIAVIRPESVFRMRT